MDRIRTIPAVSIVIPIYNRIGLLIETLESIRNQSFTDFEVLLIDDGSEDINIGRLRNYIRSINDRRFLFKLKPKYLKSGANTSRVFGFQNSRGEFIKWFDSDDLMGADLLQKQYTAIIENDLDGVLVNSAVYNEDCSQRIKSSWRKLIYSERPLEDYLKTQLAWPTPSGLWKKNSILGIDPFSQDLKNGQEWIFHLFVLTSNFKIGVIDEELIKIRCHPDSISSKKTQTYILNRIRSRIIALSRLHETRNKGVFLVLKSIYMMVLRLKMPYYRKAFRLFFTELKLGRIYRNTGKVDLRLIKVNQEKKCLENDFHYNSNLQQSVFAFKSHTEYNKSKA